MSTVYLVPAADFIKALSEELKKTYTEAIHAPPWGEFVRTGAHQIDLLLSVTRGARNALPYSGNSM